MEKPPQHYEGCWIPRKILSSEKLPLREKMVLAVLNDLEKGSGSFASNQFFTDVLGMSSSHFEFLLKKLQKKKIIRVSIRNRNQRLIFVAKKWRCQKP